MRAVPAATDPWAREKITIHLSAPRKARLARIAGGMPGGSTPTEAVERAIELASAKGSALDLGSPAGSSLDILERLDEMRDDLARLASEARDAMSGHQATQRDTSDNVRAILDLISGAPEGAEIGERDFMDGDPEPAPELGAWLRAELARIGRSEGASAVASLVWTGAAKATARLATLSFDASIVAVDGERLGLGAAAPRAVQLGLVEIDSGLFRAVAGKASRPLYIVAKGLGEARVECAFYASSDDGSLAEGIGGCGI